MFLRLWKALRLALCILAGFISFFVVIEVLRAYVVLRAVHPVLGLLFLIALLLALVGLGTWYALTAARRPIVLRPPAGVDPATAQGRQLRAYARFQVRLMRRLASNPRLSLTQQENLNRQSLRLREALAAGRDAADLSRCVRDSDAQAIQPCLAPLDHLAEQEIAHGVRDVMMMVTLSPWRSADLLVVLFRNLRTVLRLSEIYNARPTLLEQILIVRDVFLLVASINVLNYGTNLLQNLTASLPLLGRVADDVAQGIGAGLLTSVTGHSAQDRCRSFGRWSQDRAEQVIRRRIADFLKDVKRIVLSDIVQLIRSPVEAQLPEGGRPATLPNQIRDSIATAIDQASRVMDTVLVRPGAAGPDAARDADEEGGFADARNVLVDIGERLTETFHAFLGLFTRKFRRT